MTGEQKSEQIVSGSLRWRYIIRVRSAIASCDVFRLPSASSLRRWVQHIRIELGINEHVISLLRLKAESLSGRDRSCVLMMDEMFLKTCLRYCKLRDTVVGFDDDGEIKSPKSSSSVLIFMLRGLFANWKHCVGFVLTSHALQADNVKTYLLDTLFAVERVGLSVRAVVSDQGSTFCKMFDSLGITSEKPWLELNNNVICVFPDPPRIC